jgi:predicted Holliday junction resolvase-like endonuclease
MEVVIMLVLVAVVAVWITVPLRRGTGPESALEDPRMAELEARKQAKYREIRDAELDHAQNKLSDEEFARQDAELRRDAIAILKEVDEARAADGGDQGRDSGASG